MSNSSRYQSSSNGHDNQKKNHTVIPAESPEPESKGTLNQLAE